MEIRDIIFSFSDFFFFLLNSLTHLFFLFRIRAHFLSVRKILVTLLRNISLPNLFPPFTTGPVPKLGSFTHNLLPPVHFFFFAALTPPRPLYSFVPFVGGQGCLSSRRCPKAVKSTSLAWNPSRAFVAGFLSAIA